MISFIMDLFLLVSAIVISSALIDFFRKRKM